MDKFIELLKELQKKGMLLLPGTIALIKAGNYNITFDFKAILPILQSLNEGKPLPTSDLYFQSSRQKSGDDDRKGVYIKVPCVLKNSEGIETKTSITLQSAYLEVIAKLPKNNPSCEVTVDVVERQWNGRTINSNDFTFKAVTDNTANVEGIL